MIMVLGGSSTDLYISSLPHMAERFAVDADIVNLTLSMFALGFSLGCLLAGFFSDRFGRRKSALTGVLGFSVCAALIAIAPSLTVIIVLRFFQALFLAGATIVCWQIATEIFEGKEQIAAVGMMILGLSVSPAVAPVVGAYLAYFFSWRACFTVSAFLGAMTFLLLYRALPETLKKPLPFPSLGEIAKIFASFFRVRMFVCYALITTVLYSAYFSFISMSSFIYIDSYGMNPRLFSQLFILLSGASFSGNWLLRKLGNAGIEKRQIVYYGLLISVAGVLFYQAVFFTNVALYGIVIVTVGVALTRLGYGMLAGAAQVIAITGVPERGGSATGVLFFMQFSACSLASIVVSSFHDYSVGATVIFTAILTISAVPFFVFARSRVEK
jgi:DHA1 family bicyclomycin/chloramphenicol resistance-like MFS transporter